MDTPTSVRVVESADPVQRFDHSENRIRPIRRVLVANRGEIARRVIRAAHAMGLQAVAIHSDPDAGAPFVRDADLAVSIGGRTSAESYLVAEKVLDAARRSGADAIHPGYGFLSENPAFARAVADAGLAWIGPDARVDERHGAQGRGEAARGRRGRAPGARRGARRGRLGRGHRGRRAGRRPATARQGVGRWRRQGHATGPRPRRARRGGRRGAQRGGLGIRRPDGLHGALPRARPACRGAGVRRHPRQRGPPLRA